MSFRLLETGGGKARHVSLNGCFRAGVLTGDWCFQRHPAAQTFSYSASGLRHPVWHVEKADAELSFAANRLLEGEYVSLFGWFVKANARSAQLRSFGARCSPSPHMQHTNCTILDIWTYTLANLCYLVGPFRHVYSLVLALLLARYESSVFSFRRTALVHSLNRGSIRYWVQIFSASLESRG